MFEIDGPIMDQRHVVWSRAQGSLASDVIAAFDDPGRLGRSAYAYFHVPMVAGIIVTAIAAELTIAHPGGDVTAGTAAVILGGPALYLAGNALLKWTVFAPWSWSRAVAIAVLAVTRHSSRRRSGSAA